MIAANGPTSTNSTLYNPKVIEATTQAPTVIQRALPQIESGEVSGILQTRLHACKVHIQKLTVSSTTFVSKKTGSFVYSFTLLNAPEGKKALVTIPIRLFPDDGKWREQNKFSIKKAAVINFDKDEKLEALNFLVKRAIRYVPGMSEYEDIRRRIAIEQHLDGSSFFPKTYGYIVRPSTKKQTVLEIYQEAGDETLAEAFGTLLCGNTDTTDKMRLQLCLTLAQAVSHMHAKGVIHGDLNPNNILVVHKPYLHVKLIDFGFSRFAHDPERGTRTKGTRGWVAPEVLDATNPEFPGFAADIWGLALVIHSIITSKPHDLAASQKIVLKESKSQERESAQAAWLQSISDSPDITAGTPIQRLVSTMLQRTPTRRPTAQAVVESIESCLKTQDLEAQHRNQLCLMM